LAASLWLSAAACAALALILLIRVPLRAKARATTEPQHIHVGSTSRLGGLAIFVGFVIANATALQVGLMSSQQLWSMIMSALPVLIVGLWEDISDRASPRARLTAAILSAALASAFAQGIVTRLDLPVVDGWLAYLPFAVPLTWFMVAGACNAFNIIDGTNGLAGGSALFAFLGMAWAASHVGDVSTLVMAVAMAGALTGFLLWNYPKGKVFLGDGGAYFMGFVYAQLSIQLVSRNDGISAWFVIALAAYPIIETLYSIYRRKVLSRAGAMRPDAGHLHSLLYLQFLDTAQQPPTVERRAMVAREPYVGTERRQPPERRANARVAPRLWLHGVLCLVIASLYHNDTPILIGFTLIYAILYIYCYRDAERHNEHGPAKSRRINSVGD
jgi:UDP-N-acetylmuramyl pentapeptide phosphotransferase/UDP-N-acetylglucosamine-1-phosphate transferase